MLGQTNNVPIKCNACNHLYFVDPSKANDDCQVCGAPEPEQISKQEADQMFRSATRM